MPNGLASFVYTVLHLLLSTCLVTACYAGIKRHQLYDVGFRYLILPRAQALFSEIPMLSCFLEK